MFRGYTETMFLSVFLSVRRGQRSRRGGDGPWRECQCLQTSRWPIRVQMHTCVCSHLQGHGTMFPYTALPSHTAVPLGPHVSACTMHTLNPQVYRCHAHVFTHTQTQTHIPVCMFMSHEYPHTPNHGLVCTSCRHTCILTHAHICRHIYAHTSM